MKAIINYIKEVVGGIIRVDEERISSNWIQDDKHQEIFNEIFREIENYKINKCDRSIVHNLYLSIKSG